MEATERIVEAYVRYVLGWATIPNIRCAGQNEIDLLAIDPKTLDRYHIEVSISISQGFRKLTAKPYDPGLAKQRVHQASQRRTIGFFAEKKFPTPSVIDRLAEFVFEPGNYTRVIATWGWEDEAAEVAAEHGIELWDFRDIVSRIAGHIRGSREYFADDTLRTLNLFIHAQDEAEKQESSRQPTARPPGISPEPAITDGAASFWVYENWTHRYASVHRGECSHCNHGRGTQTGASRDNGEWHGPYEAALDAWAKARQTRRQTVRGCGHCRPPEGVNAQETGS